MSSETFQFLESALVDLVRVGVAGNGAGVRQLANRLVRSMPSDLPDNDEFRKRIAEAMIDGSKGPLLRSIGSSAAAIDSELVHWSVPSSALLPRLFLDPEARRAVDQLIAQWLRRDKLIEDGLFAANTVLLSGPPGVGKTLLAHHVAVEMSLPLAKVNLAQVISSLLGGTGKNLRDAMQAALETECVLLIDEFDAVAKRRDDTSDIGELKRIVNVMLLELDQWPTERLLIAATNHEHLLDAAIVRRFEMFIDLGLPSYGLRVDLVTELIGEVGCAEWARTLVAEATAEMSPAGIEHLIRSARRESLTDHVPFERALVARAMRNHSTGFDRDLAINELSVQWNMSNREIGRIFDVSHPTVATAIKRFKERGKP